MEAICQRVREAYGITGYPVDVKELAGRMGVRVILRRWRGLPHAISLRDARAVILNSARSERSRRFDLAHELAHFLLPVKGGYHTAAENRFAAALLVPAACFKVEWLVARGEVDVLAEIFGVSERVVELRRNELIGTWDR